MNTKAKFIILSKLLEKKCPERFPMSGKKAEKNDYYSLKINKEEEPYLLLQGISDNEIWCLRWNGHRFTQKVKLILREFDINKLDIVHYYKTSVIQFDSIFDYRLNSFFRVIYIKINLKRVFSKIIQIFYNKKELVLPKRIEILKKLISSTIENENNKFSLLDVISLFHTKRWILRPDHKKIINEITFYLKSLVSSGELNSGGYKYYITAKLWLL